MVNKKAEINQVFVYVFSIIVVLFAGFLVVKFIAGFTGAVDTQADSKFYSEFDKHFFTVFTGVGSEKIYKYKLSDDVKFVCFLDGESTLMNLEDEMQQVSNEDITTLETLYDTGERIALFGDDTIINSHKPERGFRGRDGSFCIEPDNGYFSLIFENQRGTVFIEELVV